MKNLKLFGKKIREIRIERGLTTKDLANATGVDRSYISKIENGLYSAPENLLRKIINYLALDLKEAIFLCRLSNISPSGIITAKSSYSKSRSDKNINFQLTWENAEQKTAGGEVKIKMNKQNKSESGINVQVAQNQPATYCDSAFVTTNQWGVMVDFAQSIASTNTQIVTARVGMSIEHAEALVKVLASEINKAKLMRNENLKKEVIKN